MTPKASRTTELKLTRQWKVALSRLSARHMRLLLRLQRVPSSRAVLMLLRCPSPRKPRSTQVHKKVRSKEELLPNRRRNPRLQSLAQASRSLTRLSISLQRHQHKLIQFKKSKKRRKRKHPLAKVATSTPHVTLSLRILQKLGPMIN